MAGAYCSTHDTIEDPPKDGPFCYYPSAGAAEEWLWLPSAPERIGAPTREELDAGTRLSVTKIGGFVSFSDEMLGHGLPPAKPSWRSRVRWRLRCWWWDLRDRVGFAIAHSTPRDEED